MKAENFIRIIESDFFAGVPDSQLKALCDCLYDTYGIDGRHHVIAANEGNAVALAAGYHLATGRVPVVYMQNSGEGNAINPLASLMNENVYAIPCIFVIGWRGEPGIHDEPQHAYQGKVTIRLLEDMGIDHFIIAKGTSDDEVRDVMERFRNELGSGRDVAFIIRKEAFEYGKKVEYRSDCSLFREEVIRHIVGVSGDDPVVCTTGKAGRELFEIREAMRQGHEKDFLTVGSMGHASSIALGIAMNSEKRIWCIDGDGSALMHMGTMAVIGNLKPKNLIHVVINNGVHDTVGGMPTAAAGMDLYTVAESCGYPHVYCEISLERLDAGLREAKGLNELCFIEVKCGLGTREDLGRPTVAPAENKKCFMDYLRKNNGS